ncbi:hypothetical protein [Microbacterium foliorum]|uniref:hypothetical protein n=1 Tax=Microbacterium foliorum TaxID=104336 RepID=UPI001D1D5E77|nr:hypothetical protein [Microbacterium foliorum]CAH0189704.1 hypothetical protein SRABI03_01704 [Microbacterium foliorum]CAH0226788.1 hypothetical protein SRABI44_02564 [Microbacterium foliorum]
MASPMRVLAAAALSFAVAVLVAGCASGPVGTAPESTGDPSGGPGQSSGDSDDMEGTLLDDGRRFAVVTRGSSTCVPQVDQVDADGQTVSVTLADPADDGDRVCTDDLAPRASIGALPEGVNPTTEITLQVAYGDLRDDVDLDGDPSFSGVPGSPTEYLPTAGWVDDATLVLLTWGSSGCPPVVESVEVAGSAGTATFVTDDQQACTMDMVPRATLIDLGDDAVDDDAFVLTLVGGGLDGTVDVRG